MNRLQFLLHAKSQYNIQSPFLFGLYSNVLSVRLDRHRLRSLGIGRRDRYAQLRFMLADHYHAAPCQPPSALAGADDVLLVPDGSFAALLRKPHRNAAAESRWMHLVNGPSATLAVDLFDTGLLFTSPKLSRQLLLLSLF